MSRLARSAHRSGRAAGARGRERALPRLLGGEGGFTLVEVIIATLLSTIVLGGALMIFNSQQRNARTEGLLVELQQNARYAIDMVSREIQSAAQAMDPTSAFGVVAMIDGAGGEPDTLYVAYADATADTYTLKDPPGPPDRKVKVKQLCGNIVDDLNPGDFIYIANGSMRGIAYITRENPDPSPNACDGKDDDYELNAKVFDIEVVDGQRHGWLWQGNEAGSAATHAIGAAFYVDDSQANPRLVRAADYPTAWEGGPIAEGISDFQTELIFVNGDTLTAADGSDADPDNDYDDITSVRVTFTAQARRTDWALAEGQLFSRSYSVTVAPRNLMYTRNLQQ